jgi:hypothetical protein
MGLGTALNKGEEAATMMRKGEAGLEGGLVARIRLLF